MLPLLGAAVSAGTGIYNAVQSARAAKDAKKQGAMAQQLAREGDARARNAANSRYNALSSFRDAAQNELGRANTIKAERYAPITGKYSGQMDSALKDATQGVDRMAMVKQALADYDTQNQPGLQNRLRLVGQKAAALGRIGSGLTTTELSDVASEYEKNRMLEGNKMLRDATDASVNDRYRALDAVSGANQSDIGLQTNNRQFDYGTKRDAVGDRQNAISTAQSLAGTGYNNSDVINTATDNNTIATLTGGQAANRQDAAAAGASAGDALGAAGRFLAIPKNNGAIDPAVLDKAGRIASNISIPGL